ncbi:glycogen debranching protein [Escherichia coli]|nr:glycogen debranching protein [Escherichia coli]
MPAPACVIWVETCHVDGFRFDLAAVMGRTPEFRQDAPLFTAIQNCPVLSQVKLIAEPWDIAPGGYQVGNFPPLFAEWNDHFRDAARRFWLHYDLPLGAFAGAFCCLQRCFLNVMVVCRVPRLISSPRMTVLRFATAFASTINTMKQTEKKIATGPTTITVTIMVKKG